MTLASILFDLSSHPEYLDILRKEISEVAEELGPMGEAGPETLQRQWLSKLEKMDSFIAESLRMNHPVLLPQGWLWKTFSSRTEPTSPKNTWISFPSVNIMMDPEFYPNPEVFDGLRNWQKRQGLDDAANKHLATQATPSQLSFGFGNRACPGRFFSVSGLKMVLTKILLEYDIKRAGTKDPYRKMVQFSFISMDAELLMRKVS
ncbi:Fumitremorgin C monooxygenase [Madurella mycetomatis]|uniref:Fumitremorgin C monooxygenase n=1 Tax=Madurella mycetomatis TaxID=100816 RepID=A0A175VNZ1_9PEZI|nr:Fumitremorgin C monooxygenase [Madurella mycetomatis]